MSWIVPYRDEKLAKTQAENEVLIEAYCREVELAGYEILKAQRVFKLCWGLVALSAFWAIVSFLLWL